MKMLRLLSLFLVLVSSTLVACGQKGDLYFPDEHSAAEAPFFS